MTLSGPVAHPGVYEIEHGASLRSLIEAAGGDHGGPAGGAARAATPARGSTASTCAGVALSDEHLAPHARHARRGRRAAALRARLPGRRNGARQRAGSRARAPASAAPACTGWTRSPTRSREIAERRRQRGKPAERIDRLASLVRAPRRLRAPRRRRHVSCSARWRRSAREFADHARHGPCEACAQSAGAAPARHAP